MSKLRQCQNENCQLRPHIENCPKCFGFGLRWSITSLIPISANEAARWDNSLQCYTPCLVCHGTPIPELNDTHLTIPDA